MELATFLQQCIDNKTIDVIANGFENSQFSQDLPDCGVIVKDILEKLNKSSVKRVEIPTVTGAISINSLQEPLKKTSNSFSMEFHTICCNLLALCGFELSYNITIISSLKHIIKQYINHIADSLNYDDIIQDLHAIYNIYKHDQFNVKPFHSKFSKSEYSDTVINLETLNVPFKTLFFDTIIAAAEQCHKHNAVSMIEINKTTYVKALKLLLENTCIARIDITEINELLHNIGNKIAYKNWFLKAWSILYDELIVDMVNIDRSDPYKTPSVEITGQNPLDRLYDILNISVHKNKYISQFLVYFDQIITETKNGIITTLIEDYIEVNFTTEFLKYLAETMLNLYTQLAYNIYNYQRYNAFNKSSRIHYGLLYYLVLNCKPRLYEYDISQQSVLRYVLLPKKAIDESLAILSRKPPIQQASSLILSSPQSDGKYKELPVTPKKFHRSSKRSKN